MQAHFNPPITILAVVFCKQYLSGAKWKLKFTGPLSEAFFNINLPNLQQKMICHIANI